MEIDMQSISSLGTLKKVTIREVFSQPQRTSSGKNFDVMNMLLQVNCTASSSAIQELTYYFKGNVVHTLTVPSERLEFLPMLDGVFSGVVCKAR
jgi:Zn-dependent M16 (insulinase) family peptidase